MLRNVVQYKKVFVLVMTCLCLVLVLGLVTGCSRTYKSNGERIYFTATSDSGDRITYSGSITMMHSIACANCHGANGKGGSINMMMWSFEAPDITWTDLTGMHEDHQPYTEETVKQAITEGVDPAGNPLDAEMPRWNMSSRDLNDLISFLKTLK